MNSQHANTVAVPAVENTRKRVQILGTRGIPGNHGGFETFAEQLSLFLVARGWEVTVYCQVSGEGGAYEDFYEGVRRINIATRDESAAATIYFDWASTRLAADSGELVLTLGYNTAIFCGLYRLKGVPCLINMDGLEWKRQKWSLPATAWLYMNERFGCIFGNRLIADHPEIGRHLETRVKASKITMIPYGAPVVESAPESQLDQFGLEPDQYAVIIARPEPENSILEIVKAWSRKRRGMPLVVLGRYVPENVDFHKEVIEAAGDEVMFVGPQYDPDVVQALRVHTRLYIHGHQVGGTNPSLVEALGAGSPLLCHNNRFNRWVAGPGASFFSSESDCSELLDSILGDDAALHASRLTSRNRHREAFVLNDKLLEYERLLLQWQPQT